MNTPVTTNARALLQLVALGDLDAAIEAGLMEWSAHPGDGLDRTERALLMDTCHRLDAAWAARARFRARQARLECRERERRERRTALIAPQAAVVVSSSPVLPAAAAAILARARTRAGMAAQ